MHSQEPWHLACMGHGAIVCAQGATLLPDNMGVICLDIVARTDWGRGAEDEANARRIVSAINLLAGIPTEDLEILATHEAANHYLRAFAEDWAGMIRRQKGQTA